MALSEPPAVFVNAYEGMARGERYDHWREEICRGICNMDINPERDGQIDMSARIANLAPVVVASASGTSAVIGRSRQMARDGNDDFTFVCRAQSTMAFQHGDEILEIGRSEAVLGDLTRSSYGHLGSSREFMTVVIDRKALLSASPRAEDLLFKSLKVRPELDQLIGRYAELASKTAPYLDAHGRYLMGQHLVDLVALALDSTANDDLSLHGRGRQARLALMKADIAANLRREDLNIAALSRRYNLSPRQVQRLFEHNGETFSEFLLEQRLVHASKLLLNPASINRKVSDIAHSAGFSDLSYFNRAFRKRFNMTPSDMRASVQDTN